jgi:NAD(P)H dehydrogenase (quinone)
MESEIMKKKVHLVYAHPEPASLNRQLVEVAVQTLQQQGHQVLLSDLYGPSRADSERLEFVTESGHSYSSGRQARDIASEQQKLLATDTVNLRFPLWWFGMPAHVAGVQPAEEKRRP